MDVHEPTVRSYNMSRIRGKDTKPERIMANLLERKRFKFESHVVGMPGKPDFVFRRRRKVIFVNGCFWHGHRKCRYFVIPKTRRAFWSRKIEGNRNRDLKHVKALRKAGWKVLTIFECQLKAKVRDRTFSNVLKFVRKRDYIDRK